MTTPIVPSISDEQLAEIERFLSFGGSMLKVKSDALRGLIARLSAAEMDAKRYQRLRAAAARDHGISADDFDSEFDASLEAIDAAMEPKP